MPSKIYNYEEIDDLVLEYQRGDCNALKELISAFAPYLNKWVDVVTGRVFNTLDKEIAAFIGFFNARSIHELRDRFKVAFYDMDNVEVLDELIVIFGGFVKKYEKRDNYFAGYLKSTFKYRVYDLVRGKLEVPNLVLDDDLYNTLIVIHPASAPGEPETNILDDPSLFPSLSTMERTILYKRYMDGMSTNDIASLYSCTRDTINRYIRQAKAKLRSWLDEESSSD